MSAPNTNVEKQAKRHAGPLVGIIGAVIFGAILLTVYLFYIAAPTDDTPDNTPTGDAVQTDGNATITPDDAASEPGAEVLPDAGTEPTTPPVGH